MPKSRKGRRFQAKRKLESQSPEGAPAAVSQEAAVSPVVRKAKTIAVQYPYVTRELKRIGILTGVIMVILIILALVLA